MRKSVSFGPLSSSPLASILLSILIGLSLTGCGGGGGGGGGAPTPNTAPVASYTNTVNPATDSLTVSFNASNSRDNDGSISSYSWNFGDGSSGSGVTTSHQYSNSGDYTVTLTVTDNDGANHSVSDQISLTEAVARITLSRDTSTTPPTIRFDGSNSEVLGDSNLPTISEYFWRFGDGDTATGSIVNHRYSTRGDYTATLTVTDSSGDTSTASVDTTFSVSGTISAASNTVVDIDVNDPSRQNKATLGSSFQTNNNTAEAQPLPNPALVNGFVNANGAGQPPSGPSNFAIDVDIEDYYSAFLTAGQFVSLRVADFDPASPGTNNIDLELYDNLFNLVRVSTTNTEFESLAVATDGQYFIRVRAISGISKYILNISNNSLVTGNLAYGNSTDFIPGEVIIKTRAQSLNSQSSAFFSSSALTPLKGLSHNDQRRAALMTLDINSNNINAQSLTAAPKNAQTIIDEKNYAIRETLQHIEQLKLRPDIEFAEPNYRVQAMRTPNDAFYSLQWHYPQINLPQAWDISTGIPTSGPSVVVAVVDSGVVLTHRDLTGKLIGGYDFIRDLDTSQDGNGIDNDPTDPGDGSGSTPSSWHGTHVAGTIGATTNNGFGVAGISWDADIMPIRVLGQGGGSSYDVIQGVRYAAGLSNDSGSLPPRAADIINLSLGGEGFSQADQNVFNQLRSAGIIVIAAAGNESSTLPHYPAAYDNVISVSATDQNNNLAPYSNSGSSIDIAAPGGDASIDRDGDGYNDGVLSTLFNEETGQDNYAFYEGTSMATPHVAGVAALMKAVYPALNASDFDASLQSGSLTNDIGTPGRDNLYGYGLLDALKSVQQAQSLAGGTVTSSVIASPTRIDFGTTLTTRTLTLNTFGSTPPRVTSVSSTAPWLTIDDSNADINGIGDYTLTANRATLADAIYSSTISIELDNATTITVPVSMQVQSNSNLQADTGFLYILLLDADDLPGPDNDGTSYQLSTDISNGQYALNFNNIPFGEYILVAGSDVDNDFVICGVGESCGYYPTNDQPQRIIIDDNQENINFAAAMVSNVISSALNQDEKTEGFTREAPESDNSDTKQLSQ